MHRHLPFETSEFQARVDRVRQEMARQGLDLLIVTCPANMNYLTGYRGETYYVMQAVLLAASQAEPVWVGRKMDVPCGRRSCWMRDENVIGYPEVCVESPDAAEMGFIAEQGLRLVGRSARVGVELDSYYFPPRAYERLRSMWPADRLVDASGLVNRIRAVKSPTEQQYMRQAAEISARAMGAAVETIRPGVRECDAAAAITAAMISGTPDAGGDHPTELPLMPSGDKTDCPHLSWSDSPYLADTAVNIELGGCRHRYTAGLARTIYLGRPPEPLLHLASVVEEGFQAALSAMQPGGMCEDPAHRFNDTIARYGFEKDSRIGYGIGLGFPPVWIERSASLRAGDRTVLVPGMTFHMILGMWRDSWSYVFSETILIGDSAPEVLTRFPGGVRTPLQA